MTKPQPLAQRFWKKVEKAGDNECWLWVGTQDGKGYGKICPPGGNATLMVHRVSWEIHHGEPVPDGHHVHHLCEERACVNPQHLLALPAQDHLRSHWSTGLKIRLRS